MLVPIRPLILIDNPTPQNKKEVPGSHLARLLRRPFLSRRNRKTSRDAPLGPWTPGDLSFGETRSLKKRMTLGLAGKPCTDWQLCSCQRGPPLDRFHACLAQSQASDPETRKAIPQNPSNPVDVGELKLQPTLPPYPKPTQKELSRLSFSRP